MTKFVKKSEVKNNWYEIDAKNAIVGRLATVISKIIRGKNKTNFTPHMDMSDFIVVVNADKVVLTGNKENSKEYWRHTGYPGGQKTVSYKKMLEIYPDRVIRG